MGTNDGYRSPLEGRYASREMRAVWSPQRKHATWRRLWLALAEAQRTLGLEIEGRPITREQIDELAAHLDDIDFASAARYEQELRHDVMAHIRTLGDAAPRARPIIHLGATSQFVNCHTELLLMRESLGIVARKLARVIDALGSFAIGYRDLPTLGFTHYQPAQPTTVGKRACLWAQDFALALEEVEYRLETLRFRGVKGTTGTQASFMALFDNDETKVEQLDEMVTERMGWPADMRYVVTGQTYPRIVDAQILSTLAVAASAAHKCATDLRLLASRKEIEEPFGANQVGSSAMAYKRNPMRCERVCGMARFVMSNAQNPLHTAANQWFERTLDDSSNRRLVLPESFLAIDGILDLVHNVASGLVVYEATIRAHLMAELPFMATENILMAAVRNGADRQEAHEVIRRHSQAAADRVKCDAAENDLLDRLRDDPTFAGLDLDAVLEPGAYVGRAPEQVDNFMAEVVTPIRNRYAEHLGAGTEIHV